MTSRYRVSQVVIVLELVRVFGQDLKVTRDERQRTSSINDDNTYFLKISVMFLGGW